MLTIPKTPKKQRGRHEELPKFRLSDDSSNSSHSELNPFFAKIAQAHSITKSRAPKPFVTTANLIMTPQNCKKLHQSEPIGMPLACSTTRKDCVRGAVNEHEISRCSTITITDSDDSELDGLKSLSDESLPPQLLSDADRVQDPHVLVNNAPRCLTAKDMNPVNDLQPRPHSEPLFFMAAPVSQFRPSSVDGQRCAKLKLKHHIKKSTVAKTPRCARPTKAWLARVEPKVEEVPPQTSKPSRNTLTDAERKAVWERLWAHGTAAEHHDNDK